MTGLRREILSALSPGMGEDADQLRRRVAQGRGLDPAASGWPAFITSFARALRLLEQRGVLELERGEKHFGRACTSWVRLTREGERARARVALPGERALGALEPESDDLVLRWERSLARASPRELERLAALVEAERARRLVPR